MVGQGEQGGFDQFAEVAVGDGAPGLVDPQVDPSAIADEFWAASHPSQYDLLVNLAGWSPERFHAWLLERTVRLIPARRA